MVPICYEGLEEEAEFTIDKSRPWLAQALRDRGYALFELRGHLALPR